jgi:hypothetical protein
MANVLSQPTIDGNGLWPGSKRVTSQSLEEFEKQWVFDALKGYRYGQSFCEYFGISNASPLYYFQDTNISKRWIKYNYKL